MIKSGGLWVSPIEVKSVLAECAVVAYDSGDRLIKPMAYIVSTESPSDELVAEHRDFIKQKLVGYKCPNRFEFLPELPKTSTGKIQRFRLREFNKNQEKTYG